MITIATAEQLAALDDSSLRPSELVHVTGLDPRGLFILNRTSQATANGSTTILPKSKIGRWIRLPQVGLVDHALISRQEMQKFAGPGTSHAEVVAGSIVELGPIEAYDGLHASYSFTYSLNPNFTFEFRGEYSTNQGQSWENFTPSDAGGNGHSVTVSSTIYNFVLNGTAKIPTACDKLLVRLSNVVTGTGPKAGYMILLGVKYEIFRG
jgi:hypothetical protein